MPKKRFDGRNESIIDPDLPIIDCHHHLIDRPSVTYLLKDFLADVNAGHNVIGSVYVETLEFQRTDGPEWLRPIGEVEYANGMGAMTATGFYGKCRVAAGIVGYADMRLGARIGALLDRCISAAPDRFRGVRQVTLELPPDKEFPSVIGGRSPTGIMESDGFLLAMAELEKRALTYDAAVFHHDIPKVAAVADRVPNISIVLNHAGLPFGFKLSKADRAETFEEWRKHMHELARRTNVFCKIGGMGMPHWGFGLEDRPDAISSTELAEIWRPYVETAIGIFGAHRCMMESNFPPDGRSSGYVPLWNAMKMITRNAGKDEKAALFHQTANRVYKLNLSV